MVTRAGFVALLGAPNAGKSTLLNSLLGQKLAIVTHKAQTTRTLLRGVVQEGACQMVLLDTPGIFQSPKTKMEAGMLSAAWQGLADADAVVWIVDALKKPDASTEILREKLKMHGKPVLLALNKVDALADKKALLPLIARWQDDTLFTGGYFCISALSGDGLQPLKTAMATLMPESPYLYDTEEVTDTPLRVLAAEITREKLLLATHEEVPYHLKVETEKWEETKKGIKIYQKITTERPSQRAIILGRGGSVIRDIGIAARTDIAILAGKPVHLFLQVIVEKDWRNDAREI